MGQTKTYYIGQVLEATALPLIEDIYTIGPETWFVVQSNPNCERRAEGGLKEIGLSSVYLSRISRWRRIPRPRADGPKREVIKAPMFPGYLFIGSNRLAGPDWLKIASTDGVRRVLGFQGSVEAVSEAIMRRVRLVEAEAERQFVPDAEHRTIKPGDAVRIMDGPFAQFTARFVAMAGG